MPMIIDGISTDANGGTLPDISVRQAKRELVSQIVWAFEHRPNDWIISQFGCVVIDNKSQVKIWIANGLGYFHLHEMSENFTVLTWPFNLRHQWLIQRAFLRWKNRRTNPRKLDDWKYHQSLMAIFKFNQAARKTRNG